jgi:NADPH:quinone reductase-like Zn-dependent oxidoreductase
VLVVRQGPAAFVPVAEQCARGEIEVHIDRVFRLDEVPQALAWHGEGKALGKVVVAVGEG